MPTAKDSIAKIAEWVKRFFTGGGVYIPHLKLGGFDTEEFDKFHQSIFERRYEMTEMDENQEVENQEVEDQEVSRNTYSFFYSWW